MRRVLRWILIAYLVLWGAALVAAAVEQFGLHDQATAQQILRFAAQYLIVAVLNGAWQGVLFLLRALVEVFTASFSQTGRPDDQAMDAFFKVALILAAGFFVLRFVWRRVRRSAAGMVGGGGGGGAARPH